MNPCLVAGTFLEPRTNLDRAFENRCFAAEIAGASTTSFDCQAGYDSCLHVIVGMENQLTESCVGLGIALVVCDLLSP